MPLHFQERGTKLCLCTFSSGGGGGGLDYASAFSVEGTKLCLYTFSRGGLNYVSVLSVEGD